ncbi:adenylate/guanylate cyclase domain-containing protein [Flagellimonas allohymeniacidonis]|uniref:Guanylate cyclase domain-containing protein n=1 Tax=Flagellimonas allohymeniacidonis TaxID=2517819 RepID=A0A4Q8QH22_9FLAO|nr:adenylate/guanylate cyclase domain-containing protein [Allomuricauda hymeniacidonis]TAI49234.1 hypothetical protein EW142_05400 [Allomuricauda hymeniacidonis]
MMHPKNFQTAKKAFFFAVFWTVFALVYSILELGILGNLEYYPSTKNKYDFKSSLIYTTIGGFVVGWIQGWVEVAWLEKIFGGTPLWLKIVLKTLFYLAFIILFVALISFGINAYRFGTAPTSPEVVESVLLFVLNFSFWSVVTYMSACVFISLLFAELVWYMGDKVFLSFLLGKYHQPKQEIRIFMFLDMKSSTTIAENIGHARYFSLLKNCYADMSDAIMETSGEVYQYVGDEIVVTWPQKEGLHKDQCIECYHKISKVFEARETYYQKKYAVGPRFKAGFHMGLVTTGEIGILKKDVIYTGDVLNTTARIQGECNTYGTNLLISEQLVKKLQPDTISKFKKVDSLQLRGKSETIQIYQLVNTI